MRTIKELLIILRDHIIAENPYEEGICFYIADLMYNDLITFKEFIILRNFMHENRPLYGDKFYRHRHRADVSIYYWKYGDFKIRVQWLNHKINKYEKHF